MADKKSFIIYTDIAETVNRLSDEQAGKLFKGMLSYQTDGIIPDLGELLDFVFVPIRQQMDRDEEKWERIREKRAASGAKGGQKKAENRQNDVANANETVANANENVANATKTLANVAVNVNDNVTVNVNDNVTVTDNVTVSDSVSDASALSSSLVRYLNSKVGSNHKTTENLTKRIGELLSEGYTERDMKAVIDNKIIEWKDDAKMRTYLRPRTLFGDKFEEYASAPAPVEVEVKQKKAERIVELREKRSKAVSELEQINARIEQIRGEPNGIKNNHTEWSQLRERKMFVDQSIDNIDKLIGRMEE